MQARKGNLLHQAGRRTRTTYAYMLCGWHTHSDVLLTGVPVSAHSGENIDIRIQIAPGQSPITKNDDRYSFEHSIDRSLIRIEHVADFEVSNGRQIRVWPAAGASENDIQIFLFGPAWATLCHQRGMLPLHASAIATGSGIAAFAGHSGAGKSTTAALLNSLGYELVTDDILPVSFDWNSVAGAWPYLRRLKLHATPILQLGLTPLEAVSETLDNEKFFVSPELAAHDKWSKLERLYLLEIDPTISSASINQLTGAETVRALIDQTYHFQFIQGSGRFRDHLAFCAQLASKIDIYRIRRPTSLSAGSSLGSVISAHLESTSPGTR